MKIRYKSKVIITGLHDFFREGDLVEVISTEKAGDQSGKPIGYQFRAQTITRTKNEYLDRYSTLGDCLFESDIMTGIYACHLKLVKREN